MSNIVTRGKKRNVNCDNIKIEWTEEKLKYEKYVI